MRYHAAAMTETKTTPSLESLRIDRGGHRFTPRKRSPWPRVAVLAVVVLAVVGWTQRDRLARMVGGGLGAIEVRTGVAVKTRPAASLELTSASGYVVPRREASLASRHAARLVDLLVDVGDRVEKDQVIARLEDDVWRNRRDLAAAEVREAESTVKAASDDVAVAQKRIERLERDIEEAAARVGETEAEIVEARRVVGVGRRLEQRGAGTTDAREKAVNELARLLKVKTSREAAVATMRGERDLAAGQREASAARRVVEQRKLETARVRLKEAEDDLADTIVRAPFAGVVTRKEADVGEVVVPALAGGGSNRGAVVHVVDFSSLEMEVDVFERDIGLVVSGRPARIFLDSRPNEPFPGRVRQVVPTADRSKATVQVKVSFDRLDEGVLPEMGGRVVFLREEPEGDERPFVTAPAGAVVTRDGARGVFTVAAGVVRFRTVEVGARRGDRIVIASGLKGGERVVIEPPPELADGTRVEIADV